MAEGAVRSVFVEMLFELVENEARVSLVDDQDAVEEFPADGADEAFGDRVGPGVPETPHTSRDVLILVEQSTEPVAPADRVDLA